MMMAQRRHALCSSEGKEVGPQKTKEGEGEHRRAPAAGMLQERESDELLHWLLPML